MPTHNSPRWRAENEGRPDLLAVEIAKRRARRGYSWEVGYEERRWLDDLTESLRERFDEYLGGGPRVSVFSGTSEALRELLETPRGAPSDVEWPDLSAERLHHVEFVGPLGGWRGVASGPDDRRAYEPPGPFEDDGPPPPGRVAAHAAGLALALGPERARTEGRRKRRTPQWLPDLPPGGPIVSLKIRPLSGEDDT